MQMKRIAGSFVAFFPEPNSEELVHLRELDRLGLVLVSALVGCQRAAEPAAGDLDEDTQVDLLLPGVLLDDVDPERRDLAGRRRLGPLALRHRASEPPGTSRRPVHSKSGN